MKQKLKYFFFLFSFIIYTKCFADTSRNLTLNTSISRSSVLIGQVIEIYFELPSEKKIIFPPIDREVFGFDILALWDTVTRTEQSVFVSLKLTRFDTGHFEFKPLIFLADSDTLESESMTINVSLPELSDTIEIFDIKPNVSFYDDSWIAVVILAFLITGILYFIFRRYRKYKSKNLHKKPEIIEILEDQIQEKIKMYKNMYLNNSLSPRDFYFHVDEVLREYLEKKYSYNFLESTATEVCKMVARLSLSMYYAEMLQNFFTEAELIKFAKAEHNTDVTNETIDKILEFLNSQKINPFSESVIINYEKNN